MEFIFNIDPASTEYRFQQLAGAIIDAINRNLLTEGDLLPSVNQMCREYRLSRDTVFKAYNVLKTGGFVESVPNRGYYVAKTNKRVLLFLDTFKAYKEVLYAAFTEHKPDSVSLDLHFHHYNIEVFERTIANCLGKYSYYVVMSFDHPRVEGVLNRIPPDRLLLIDWEIHGRDDHSYVRQDFGAPVYDNLALHIDLIRKYDRFIYLYPEFTYHPKVSVVYFMQFITDFKVNGFVIDRFRNFDVRKGDLYLLVSDRTLASFFDQCTSKGLEPGIDAGVISYNETPMKRYIKNGVTVISTDFNLLGREAAMFIASGNPVKVTVPTDLIRRSSA